MKKIEEDFCFNFLHGIVRFNDNFITVECPKHKIAFSFKPSGTDGFLRAGNWVNIRGCTQLRIPADMKIDTRIRNSASWEYKLCLISHLPKLKRYESKDKLGNNIIYLHEPFDGSNRSEWSFFLLKEFEYNLSGPPEFITLLQSCMILTRRHIDKYAKYRTASAVSKTIKATKLQLQILEHEKKILGIEEKERRARVKVIDLD